MTKVRTWVGLDVHAAKVVACVVDALSGEMTVHRLPGDTSTLVAFCAALPGATRVAYEAGPTGFGLARALAAARIGCVIAAPGKIERPSADRVKTDQRDAERLVRLLMIDALHAVRVPGNEEEAPRQRPAPRTPPSAPSPPAPTNPPASPAPSPQQPSAPSHIE
jgi:transposase